MRLIPRTHILKLDAGTTEDVQCTPNCEVDLAAAQLLYELQVFDRPAPARVCDGDAAPLSQLCHELVVDAALQALDVGGVDQEFRTVRFEEFY